MGGCGCGMRRKIYRNLADIVIAMAKRLKKLDIPYLLDFHYSDWWADPEHQNIPKAWKDLSVDAMAQELFAFTEQALLALKEADVYPDMIQIGNEIRNGMLFPVAKVPKWENLAKIVNSGIAAARKVNADTKLMIHLDEVLHMHIMKNGLTI